MEKFEQKDFDINESIIKECYLILDAKNPKDLYLKYLKKDQELMQSKEWDYKNSDLLINKIKEIIEFINGSDLLKGELDSLKNILWLWYHHAISCAIWRYKDKEKAIEYSEKALSYQDENNTNKITRILSLLVQDKLIEAKTFLDNISDDTERDTAEYLIGEYEKDKFFK